jgi:hypothetical protein
MPRVGSAAQLGQQLGPVGQLLLDQQPVIGPVDGGLAALQQPGRGQDQRPGAHRPDHRGRVGRLAQLLADRRVAHGLDRGRTSAGTITTAGSGTSPKVRSAVTVSGPSVAMGDQVVGHHHRPVLVADLPQAGKDLQRTDQIQQREPSGKHERDRLRLGVAIICPCGPGRIESGVGDGGRPCPVDRCRMTPAMADRAASATPRVSTSVARCLVAGSAFSSDPES